VTVVRDDAQYWDTLALARLCAGRFLDALRALTLAESLRPEPHPAIKNGNALASGGSTYESDDDLELVGSALPVGLKLMESLLAESPAHPGLLHGRRARARDRARRLFLRGHRYGFQALATGRPGFSDAVNADPASALRRFTRKQQVPLLYWNAAALGLAISVSKNDAGMLARLPEVAAQRAIRLDEMWGQPARRLGRDRRRSQAPRSKGLSPSKLSSIP
jgi:hypothetical protein